MGARQANNLQHEGYSLVVYDRSIMQLEEFSKRDNVEVACSPAALAETEGAVSMRIAVIPAKHISTRLAGTITHQLSLQRIDR